MARSGPRKVARYGDRFKATAVKLSSLPGVLIQDVAAALDIHPFMLSLWRKQVRDGVIVAKSAKLEVQTTAELKRLKELERRYKVLKEEHELLKKAIRFASDRKRRSSSSSRQTGGHTRSR
ncbi:MAG: transposase [Burkholderiales bacterium]